MAATRLYFAAVGAVSHVDDFSTAWFLRDAGESRTALCGRDLSVSLNTRKHCSSANAGLTEKQKELNTSPTVAMCQVSRVRVKFENARQTLTRNSEPKPENLF